jgi:hypothetical protein
MKTLTTDNYLVEYMKIYLISLKQDLEKIEDHEVTNEGYPKEYIQGAIAVLNHILEVANDYV